MYSRKAKRKLIGDMLMTAVFAAAFTCAYFFVPENESAEFEVTLGALEFALIAILFVAVLIVCVIISVKNTDKTWDGIWKEPVWLSAVPIIMSVCVLVFAITGSEEAQQFTNVLLLGFFASIVFRDWRNYTRAVKYGVDDLKDVKELVEKHPETKALLSKRALNH